MTVNGILTAEPVKILGEMEMTFVIAGKAFSHHYVFDDEALNFPGDTDVLFGLA